MSQEVKLNMNEIIVRLAKLESDLGYIKEKIEFLENNSLKSEIGIWEETSIEDSVDFFEKHNL